MQGRMRAITRDVDFERELKNAGESLVVADFKADWWVGNHFKICIEFFLETEKLHLHD